MATRARQRTLLLGLIGGLTVLLSGGLSLDVRGEEVDVPVLNDANSLFGYGSAFGDVGVDSNEVTAREVPNLKFLFFGNHHEKVYISRHGHISFTLKPTEVYRNDPLPHEHPDVPDPPMAAVFFATSSSKTKVNDKEKSMIYYKVLRSTDANTTRLQELGRQVRINAVTNMIAFNPTHALIVTWHNLRNDGCDSQDTCPRNTFQAAIVTDGLWTYAIYNYKELKWLGGILEDCDRNTGLGANCFKAQVGFNAGYGRRFVAMPGSNTDQALDLATIQGSRTVGRHIYRVSHDKVLRDACTSVDHEPMAIFPESSLMVGGTEVYAAGPCLTEPFGRVKCWVQNPADGPGVEVEGRVIDSGRVACIMPPLTTIADDIKLWVTTGSEYFHHAVIKIEAPHRRWLPVRLHSYRSSWLQRDPPELSFSWPPTLLNSGWLDNDHENITGTRAGVDEENVDILLYGFRESAAGDPERPQREWKLLTVIANGQANSGTFTFKPAEFRCIEGKDCDWHLGAIKVQPSRSDSDENARGLYSGMFPLGWYVEDVMTKRHGENWPEVLCEKWKDPALPNPDDESWQEQLLPCPCTAAQAYTDAARFIVGAECDGNTTEPVPCPMSPEAKVCYVSSVPTPRGAQTRCCYNSEGLLLSSADGPDGSYSGRVHEDGLHPYTAVGTVPILSHWWIDRLPYIWCCVWSSDPNQCMLRYEPERRTPECSQHKAASTAFAFGDPHFMTFDGTNYTFNGYSEYWLVRVNKLQGRENLQLQARMQSSIGTIPGNLKATIITAVALQQGDNPKAEAPKVTFLLNPPLALQRIAVYVDGIYRDFHIIPTRNFRRSQGSVTIYRRSSGQTHSNFTAVTDTGVSVTVAEKAGVLQVITVVPPTYFKKTDGLFGFWDGNAKNDLRRKDGVTVVDPTNAQDVHDKFGLDWTVQEEESIFTYFGKMGWQSFEDKTFLPNFIPDFPSDIEHNVTEAMVKQKCNNNEFCTFDYMTTLSAPIADASLQAEAWAIQSKAMIADVVACPYIYIEWALRKAGGSNLAGGQVQLTGCMEEYTLIGSSSFECIQDGEGSKWSPPTASTYCKANYIIEEEKQRMAVAISVPLVLIFVAALAAVLIFFVLKRRKQDQSAEQNMKNTDDQKPSINPMPSMYPAGAPMTQSRTSLTSRGSTNSIILTEPIVAQRPQRPVKPKAPPPHEDPTYDVADGRDAKPPPPTTSPPYTYDNPDSASFGQPEAEVDAPHPRVQFGGTGTARPTSTMSYFGPESHSRSRDDPDEHSLDGEHKYAQMARRPYPRGGFYSAGGHDNAGVATGEGPPGMASSGRFGYQPPPPTHFAAMDKNSDTMV